MAEAFGTSMDTLSLDRYHSMLSKKWMVTSSLSYFRFIEKLILNDFELDALGDTEEIQLMATMLYYDFYQNSVKDENLKVSIKEIGANQTMVQEMVQFLKVRIDSIDFEEFPCLGLPYTFPLRIHARYTRDQILVAMRLSTLEKKSSSREGVALNKELNTEALFINLQKTEEDFSPTTMYDDYAINEYLFHWQSQNQTSSDSTKGMSYIQQKKIGKKILLFVRESRKDAYGFTQGYVFIGLANYVEHSGSKPMSITWKLDTPLPEYLWSASAKMVSGG